MSENNLSYVLYGKQDLRPENKPLPALNVNEVRIRITRMGICGSDVHYFQHGRVGSFVPKRPFVLGHEAAGEVVEVGAEVTRLKVGSRVAIDPAQPCRVCKWCRAGKYNLCPRMKYFGSAAVDPHVDGLFREYAVVPEFCCYELPDSMDYALAALLEPLSVAIHSIRRAGMVYGASVLVMGGGTIGQLILAAAQAFGAGHLTVSDVDEGRRQFALAHFADQVVDAADPSSLTAQTAPGGEGYDVVFEAAGVESALQKSLEVAARGGTVVQVGSLPLSVNLPANLIMTKELTVVGSFRFANVFQIALNLACEKSGDLLPIVTHTLPFAQFLDAMQIASARGQALKVQVAT